MSDESGKDCCGSVGVLTSSVVLCGQPCLLLSIAMNAEHGASHHFLMHPRTEQTGRVSIQHLTSVQNIVQNIYSA